MKKTEKIFVLNPSENNSFVLTQKTVELEVPAATTAQVTQNEEFARTCRICATTTDYAVPIFTGEGRQNNLCEKIETHLPIMVSPEDHLPQQICVSCAHTLLAWHELVACCRQANDALHMRLHQMQQEQEPQPSTSRETRSQKNKAQKRRILTEVVEEQDDLTSDVKETKLISEFTDKLDIVPSVTVAEDGKKYIECDICKKSMISASWKRHLRCHRGEKRYSCHSCGLCFSDSGNLARHTRAIHSNQRPYSCPICHKTFSRNSHLQDHVRSHSETREFVCDLCGKASKSSAALRMHRKVHLNACYTCVECGAKFRRIGELRAHALVHSGQRDHRCTCGKGFRLRGQLTRHRRTCQSDVQDETSEPPPYEDFGQEHCINYPKCPIVQSKLFFHCADCDTYIDLNQLRLHMTLHACHKSMKVESKKKTEEVKDVNANTQPPVTTSRAIMIRAPARVPPVALPRSSKNEFSDHSDTEDFEPLPESVFEAIEDSQDAQEDPEPSTSQNVARNYECHVCGEKFVQQRRLDHHMTSHDGGSAPATNKNTTDRKTRSATAKNRLRKCPKCDKEYTASSSYFYHLKYGHAPKKDKACDICGTTFATVMCLKSHRASVHAVEAGFKCRFCEKTFRSKASVYIHEQTHVGDKRHTCGQCGQSFRWRTHLARHVSRHAAARVGTAGAHVCTRCGKSFAVSYDLRRHAATHSAGTHACKSCGATFAQPRYLKVHMSKKHADDASVSSADATKCSSPSAKSSSSDASELHTKYTKY